MEIVFIDGQRVSCWKIEPSLKPGYVVVNEWYAVPVSDIICIIPERK